jgi:iron(III) transport system ATP-binding protein
LTVEENVAFGLDPFSETQLRHKNDLLRLLELADLLDRYPHQISGGEQQRVAVARALARQPDVILFDEPFSNLDANLRPRMRAQLKKVLRHLETTSLFVTHDQTEAMELADRVAVLREGRLEQLDLPEKIYHFPATPFVAEFVGDAESLRGTVKNGLLLTELGELELPAALGAHPLLRDAGADGIDVMIRPQDVELKPLSDGDDESRARIVLRQFRGSEVVYTVRLPNGAEVRAQQSSLLPCPEGARVEIRLRAVPALFYKGKRIE